MGFYDSNTTWEKCTIYDISSDGYNVRLPSHSLFFEPFPKFLPLAQVWFHIDPVNEFRDLHSVEVSWAVANIGRDQNAPDLSPGCYACDLVVEELDEWSRWHVRLWRDIDAQRPRTFLLPRLLVHTGAAPSLSLS